MMNLKTQYLVSSIGIVIGSFGAGWIMLSSVLGIPKISWINGIGAILCALGIAITIKTLSTIKDIKIEVDEE